MQLRQRSLFPKETKQPFDYPFPSTRYQGSKRSLVEWIWEHLSPLEFNSVLDVFGGTGVVSHMLKNAGKQVTYNDFLAFNYNIVLALIENHQEILSNDEIEQLLCFSENVKYLLLYRRLSTISFSHLMKMPGLIALFTISTT